MAFDLNEIHDNVLMDESNVDAICDLFAYLFEWNKLSS
jgi:hypothetical protein